MRTRHAFVAGVLLGGGLFGFIASYGALMLTEPVHRSLHDAAARALVGQARAEQELAAYRVKARRTR